MWAQQISSRSGGNVKRCRVVRAYVFDVSPLVVRVFAAAAVILVVLAVLASAPARRASRIDLLVALRSE